MVKGRVFNFLHLISSLKYLCQFAVCADAIGFHINRYHYWRRRAIMSYNENETRKIAHPRVFCGAENAHFALLMVLELKGTRSLPTSGLCQPRSSPEPQSSYRSTMPL